MLLKILNRTDVPLLTTLHTVLDRPDTDQRRVLEAVIRRSARMIVMSEKGCDILRRVHGVPERSEEHTSELQSLMRISYAVFCLKKKTRNMQPCLDYKTNL